MFGVCGMPELTEQQEKGVPTSEAYLEISDRKSLVAWGAT